MEENRTTRFKSDCKIKGADIFCGKNILGKIPSAVKEIFKSGTVCIVHDAGTKKYAVEMAGYFKQEGFKTMYADTIYKTDIPEYIRFVFGVGAGNVSDKCKWIANKLDIDYSFLYTAPSTDTILCGKSPKQVFIDENVLLNCPFECVAAGWGMVLSEQLNEFEGTFSTTVLSKGSNENGGGSPLPYDKINDRLSLAVKLIEMSASRRKDTADIMSHILYANALKEGKKPRLLGEYKYVCSCALCVFYFNYLSSPSIDVMLPMARYNLLEKMKMLTGLEIKNDSKSVDFFDVNSYFRISYILGEYRTDLLEKLSNIDLHSSQRFWRRLYPDAGYWLKSELTSKKILDALWLASGVSDGLLGYAGASGVTEVFA